MADRRREARPPPNTRSNEYFVPKDGIDREVITADICRYLGNDALVRPGFYENPQTRTRQDGYFINAYRNLTSAMIADLKADSARWEQERRQSASRSNVGYKNSATHESRQYYGPTESAHQSTVYTSAPISNAQTAYDSSNFPGQQPQQYFSHQPANYASQQQYVNDNHYVAGANMEVDPQPRQRVPVTVAGPNVSGSNAGFAQTRSSIFPEERSAYYQQPPVTSSQQYPSQQADSYNGRGAYNHQPSSSIHLQDREASNFSAPAPVPATYQQGPVYDSEYPSDSRYPNQSGYNPPPMDGSYSPASANPRRPPRDQDPDPRDSRRSHHRR